MSLGSKLMVYDDTADNETLHPSDKLKLTELKLTTTGGTPTGLTFYESFTDNIIWGGPWAANQNGTAIYTRIGNLCVATFSGLSAATTANAAAVTTTDIPARFKPTDSGVNHFHKIVVVDQGSNAEGWVFTNNGNNFWTVDLAGPNVPNGFTAVGNSGWFQFSICYYIA